MPAKSKIYPFETFRGQGVTLLARCLTESGERITQAALDSITVTVVREGMEATVEEDEVDISACVFDTLQTGDPRWDQNDTLGFNFAHLVEGTAFDERGQYRVEYTFTETGGNKWKLVFEGPARSSNG